MASVNIKEFKIKVNGKEYGFRLDFLALMKFEDKYGVEGMVYFNEFLQGQNVYKNIVRILSCSCYEKDFTDEELAKGLSFDLATMQLVDEITLSLVEGVIGEADKPSQKGNSGTAKN